MTDRELLGLAAKAAGIELKWPIDPEADVCARRADIWKNWNPLTDDGDALRLAVAAQIEYAFGTKNDQIVCVLNFVTDTTYIEDCGGDVCATVRRAIVLAAAEIGRAKP